MRAASPGGVFRLLYPDLTARLGQLVLDEAARTGVGGFGNHLPRHERRSVGPEGRELARSRHCRTCCRCVVTFPLAMEMRDGA